MFSHYKSIDPNEPRGVANLEPRGMIGSIYEGTTRHSYMPNKL